MNNKTRRALEEAQEYLGPLSEEDFTAIFPSWKTEQKSHIRAGLSVEESWDLFCHEWIRLGKPRVLLIGI